MSKLNCLKCSKWFDEENLIIIPKGSYCEDCYYESIG
ncbi:hypothetical protein GvMRE_I1g693 [endosymbiont GvMRE of Glomus versiforme]|nr:hypothetical protein GvMRE_I1g693 [endosymbiont GvMRE of Glomus versiforme]